MPAKNVSGEIRHLMRDKGYPQKRAVAASLSMAREGKFGKREQRQARQTARRGR